MILCIVGKEGEIRQRGLSHPILSTKAVTALSTFALRMAWGGAVRVYAMNLGELISDARFGSTKRCVSYSQVRYRELSRLEQTMKCG